MSVRATAATFGEFARNGLGVPVLVMVILDRKSTRLNSSHI